MPTSNVIPFAVDKSMANLGMGKRKVNQIGLDANHMDRLALASRNQPQWHSTVMLQ